MPLKAVMSPRPAGTLAFPIPEVETHIAFVLQSHIEHALTGEHPALPDLSAIAIRNYRDVVPMSKQSDAQLQPGLPSADNFDCSHFATLDLLFSKATSKRAPVLRISMPPQSEK